MIRAALLGLALVLGTGCGLDEFDVVIVEDVRLPLQRPQGPFSPSFQGAFNNLDLSANSEFQNNDVSPSDVDGIFVRSLVVEVIADGPPELSVMSFYLSGFEYWVEADDVSRAQLGVLDDIPAERSVAIPVDPSFNLKAYAVAPRMRVGAELDLLQLPAVNVTLRTTLTLLVDIDLLGN